MWRGRRGGAGEWMSNARTSSLDDTSNVAQRLPNNNAYDGRHATRAMIAMSSQSTAETLGDVLLQSVAHGAFPQDEQVASAAVPWRALSTLRDVVNTAREQTKVIVPESFIPRTSANYLCTGPSTHPLSRSRS